MFLAMHISDGFLNIPVSLAGWVLTIVVVGLALRRVGRVMDERQSPLMGVLAAFVFAAQMINFPVAGGTSGHLVGGMLVAALIGPWAAVLVMTCVVGVQALIFQDGGLVVMGFNIFNMGILAPFVGYAVYRGLTSPPGPLSAGSEGEQRPIFESRATFGLFLGAWLSVEIGALATALEIAASGTSDFGVAIPAMLAIHALIGIGEGLITVAAVSFVQQARPDLLKDAAAATRPGLIAAGLVVALIVVVFSPLASSHPDGLEKVAEDHDFLDAAEGPVYEILPDYTIPAIDDATVTTILAGAVGVLMVASVGYGVTRLVRRTV